jgi:hypothetical protein
MANLSNLRGLRPQPRVLDSLILQAFRQWLLALPQNVGKRFCEHPLILNMSIQPRITVVSKKMPKSKRASLEALSSSASHAFKTTACCTCSCPVLCNLNHSMSMRIRLAHCRWERWWVRQITASSLISSYTSDSFIVFPNTQALSHRKSASARIPCDNCRAQGHDKRGTCISGIRGLPHTLFLASSLRSRTLISLGVAVRVCSSSWNPSPRTYSQYIENNLSCLVGYSFRHTGNAVSRGHRVILDVKSPVFSYVEMYCVGYIWVYFIGQEPADL